MNTNDSGGHGQADVANPNNDPVDPVDPTDPIDPTDPASDSKNNRNESDADRLSRFQRSTNQQRKKLGLDPVDFDQKPTPAKKKSSDNSTEFNYSHKAFLKASGLNTEAEMNLAWDASQSTGKSLEQVLESKWFKEDLEMSRSKSAIPSGKNRSGNPSASDTVDYWIEKGELPPANQTKLRQQVVNAKIARSTTSNPFTKNPVVQ